MSLIRLGSAATRRQIITDPGAIGFEANGNPLTLATQSLTRGSVATQSETESNTEKAFEQLVQYFPTETVTLFLAAVSMVQTFDHVPWVMQLRPFGLIAIFTLLTPLMLLMAAFATFREEKRAGRIPKPQKFEIPIFELCASAIAFVPWALAVPGLFPDAPLPSPTQAGSEAVATTGVWTAEIAQVFAAFSAFWVSWLLSQLRRILAPI